MAGYYTKNIISKGCIVMRKNRNLKELGLFVSLVSVFLFISLIVSTLHLGTHKQNLTDRISFYGYGIFLDKGEKVVKDDYNLNYRFWGVPEIK